MSRSPSIRRLSVRSAGPLLTAALWAALPQAAEASCGDWLAGHRGSAARSVDESLLAGFPIARDSSREAPGGRCNGPQCEGRPSEFPPAHPAPTVSPAPDHLATLTEAALPGAPGREGFGRGHDVGRETFVPFRPDRPPKV